MEDQLTTFTHQDYEILERKIVYQGAFRLVRYALKHKTFKGQWTDIFNREILERRDAVAILPYDPIKDEVILIEQFRAGSLGLKQTPWLLEIVAGVIDDGESTETVAKREALEEAGTEILNIYPLCEYFVSPGGSNEYLHLFIGEAHSTFSSDIFGLHEEHEDIRAFTLKSDEAFKLIAAGHIKTSPAIIALQWLQINKKMLRELWQK